MPQIATFVQRQTDIAIGDMNPELAKAMTKETMAAMKVYIAILSKSIQDDRTQEARSPTVEGSPDVNPKTAMRSAKTAMLNDTPIHLNRRKGSVTQRKCQNLIKSYYRRISDTAASKA